MKAANCIRALAWVAAMIGLSIGGAPIPAVAQDYPAKPIRLLVGFPPGGNADLGARIVAQKMSDGLGRAVIVENKTGGGGTVANAYVAKANPDGYTLLLIIGGFVTQAATMKKLPYDSTRDFSPISLLVTYPIVIAVASDSEFKTLNDLITYAKSNPGKLNYGAPIGTLYHLLAEMFSSMAGIDMTFVPYRGGSEPMTEVVAGRMDVLFEAITNASPQLRGGKLRALAVTSAERVPALPELPTIADFLPGYEATSFEGIAAPKGTPVEIVDKLNGAINAGFADTAFQAHLAEPGGEGLPGTPAQFRALVTAETEKWGKVVRFANLKAE